MIDTSWHEERSIPVPESGCWLWLGCVCNKGYGLVTIARETRRAHRVGYQIATGIAPGSLHVLHKCDTPRCINPAHLFLGTNAENVMDKVRKGRQAVGVLISARMCGERQGISKLTTAQVLEIRRSNESGVDLARRFNISQSVISEIRHRKSWTHVEAKAA